MTAELQLATLSAGNFSSVQPPAETARLAVYKSAEYNPMQAPATRIGTNPDSAFSQIQRVRLSQEGEAALKNTGFAKTYCLRRKMYCSSGAMWAANTGNDELNTLVQEYVMREWGTMGVNCSLLTAFGRVGDCWLPEKGDAALRIVRTKAGKMKVEEISADRIGEIYWYQDAFQDVASITLSNGAIIYPQEDTTFKYSAGLYFDGPTVVAYKIYQRRGDTQYYNPKNYPASEILFFHDDIMGGVRGVSAFATALLIINGKSQILKATIQTMQQQSKTAAIASNNSGSPSEFTYQTVNGSDGTIEYQETYADGAVVKYQFNGDSYQVLKAMHPSKEFVDGMVYLDWDAAGTMGLTGEFLFTPKDSGGAPSRFSFSLSSREIDRIRQEIHRPKLEYLAFLTIAQGIAEKKLPASAGERIYKGTVHFGVLPTADAFRDSKSDILEDRAGFTTKDAICSSAFGESFAATISKRKSEEIMIRKAVKEVNDELNKLGLPADVTRDNLAMLGDQPQQDAQAEEIDKKDGVTPPKKKAAMSADVNQVSTPTLHEALRGRHVTLKVQPVTGPARAVTMEAGKAHAYISAKLNSYQSIRDSLN